MPRRRARACASGRRCRASGSGPWPPDIRGARSRARGSRSSRRGRRRRSRPLRRGRRSVAARRRRACAVEVDLHPMMSLRGTTRTSRARRRPPVRRDAPSREPPREAARENRARRGRRQWFPGLHTRHRGDPTSSQMFPSRTTATRDTGGSDSPSGPAAARASGPAPRSAGRRSGIGKHRLRGARAGAYRPLGHDPEDNAQRRIRTVDCYSNSSLQRDQYRGCRAQTTRRR